jgi:hypothetical protein
VNVVLFIYLSYLFVYLLFVYLFVIYLFIYQYSQENARLKVKLFQYEKQANPKAVVAELPKKELTPSEHRALVVKV